jgi:hypothetical protein
VQPSQELSAAPAQRPEAPLSRGAAAAGPSVVDKPVEFVCEDDVRQAIRQGRKITIGERTIVTPAARDLAEQHRVLVQASWRSQDLIP